MYCLMEFCKMSFPIHFDFSLLAGIIIRPLFTTFCLCFLLSFSKKITVFMLGTLYCIRCFLSFFLGKNVFSHPLQVCVHHFSQVLSFMTFLLLFSNILQMLYVIAQDGCWIYPRKECFLAFTVTSCSWLFSILHML